MIAPGRALALADVIVSATGAQHPVLRRDDLERARGGRSAPLLVIDLAIPRDVDPAVAGLPGVELLGLDDLQPLVERTLAQRRSELPAAQAVLDAEVARFTTWLRRRESPAHAMA